MLQIIDELSLHCNGNDSAFAQIGEVLKGSGMPLSSELFLRGPLSIPPALWDEGTFAIERAVTAYVDNE